MSYDVRSSFEQACASDLPLLPNSLPQLPCFNRNVGDRSQQELQRALTAVKRTRLMDALVTDGIGARGAADSRKHRVPAENSRAPGF
jgi:hypothetical protein